MTTKRQSGSRFQYRVLQLCKKFWPEGSFHNFTSQAIQVQGKWIVKQHDLFGCIDILVMRPHDKPLAIQCTKHTGVTKKLEKMEKVNWNFTHWEIQVWFGRDDGTINIKRLWWHKDDLIKKDEDGKEVLECHTIYELIPWGIIRRGKFYKEEK